MLPCGVPRNLLKLFLGIQNNFLVHNYDIYYLKQKNRWLPDSMHNSYICMLENLSSAESFLIVTARDSVLR